MTPTPTPTSGAADDLADTVAKALYRAWQLGQTYWQQADSDSFTQNSKAEKTHGAFIVLMDKTRAALASAPAQPAAQQGVAYAATPTSNYAGRVYEEGFLIGTCPLYTADQLRAFADATYALRASHGQACPELNMGNYDEVEVERLNDWAIRAHDEIDRLHALAAGQAVVPAGPWSLGHIDGNWRDIDRQGHGGVMRIVWRMEGEERTPKCEALAHAVIAALNGDAAPAQPVAEQGVASAALPDEREAFEAMMRSQTFDSLKRLSDGSYESYEARVGWLAWNVRASHGRAPAPEDSVQEDALSDAVRVPLDSLHADAAYLIGRLRDGSMPYARVIEIIRERIDAAKAAIRARAARGQAPAQPDPAYSEACNLATALFKKHFAHLPDFASGQAVWSLCDSTAGVISQIDNMVSGLVQPPTTSPQADSAQEDAARLLALEAAANQIFNNPPSETSQDVRDVIEWFSGSIRVVLDAARKQGEKQ